MYKQTYYKSMKPGKVYRCPPGGQVVLVLDNELHFDTGYVTFLVLIAGENVNWGGKEGLSVREHYTHLSCGSWMRVL